MHRQPVFDSELLDQKVTLTTNLLAVAVHGDLFLRRGETQTYVRQGQAALVTAGSLSITEIPATGFGGAEFYFCMFGDECIRRSLSNPETLTAVEKLVLPTHSTVTDIFPLPKFLIDLLPLMTLARVPFPQDFVMTLRLIINRLSAGVGMFLKLYFARRRELNLYLEQCVVPHRSRARIGEDFVGGKARFNREFRAHYAGSVEQWLTRRKVQLAYLALKRGTERSVRELAAAVGMSERQLRTNLFRQYGLRPEEVPGLSDKIRPDVRASILAPFWHWAHSPFWQLRDQFEVCLRRHTAKQERRSRRAPFGDFKLPGLGTDARQDGASQVASKSDEPPHPESLEALGDVGINKFIEFEKHLTQQPLFNDSFNFPSRAA